jgi:F-type H+-transporting ATPase subunit b
MKRVLPILLFVAVAAVSALAQHDETGASVARGAATEVAEDLHGENATGETHEEQTYFGIPAWILKALNLILFAGLLFYFLGPPIRGALDARRQKIRGSLNEAAERRAKADHLAADIQARLDQIEKEVGSILERASVEGERQKQEMITQGRAEAEKVLAQAKVAVDAQLRQAKSELTEYAGQLAAERALTILETQMTDADRRKLFAEGVEEIRS